MIRKFAIKTDVPFTLRLLRYIFPVGKTDDQLLKIKAMRRRPMCGVASVTPRTENHCRPVQLLLNGNGASGMCRAVSNRGASCDASPKPKMSVASTLYVVL